MAESGFFKGTNRRLDRLARSEQSVVPALAIVRRPCMYRVPEQVKPFGMGLSMPKILVRTSEGFRISICSDGTDSQSSQAHLTGPAGLACCPPPPCAGPFASATTSLGLTARYRVSSANRSGHTISTTPFILSLNARSSLSARAMRAGLGSAMRTLASRR